MKLAPIDTPLTITKDLAEELVFAVHDAQMLWTERKLRDEYTSEHCDTRIAGLQLLWDQLNALIDALDEP